MFKPILLCLTLAVVLCVWIVPAWGQETAITNGVNWLVTNQDPTGWWGGSGRTPFRDATEAIDMLDRLGGDPDAIAAGIAAIQTATVHATDYLAREIMALSAVGAVPPTLVDSLIARQNDDGGWGYASGYASNVLETALALKALARSGRSPSGSAGAATAYLSSVQHGDGGWSFLTGDPSNVFFTALAVEALAAVSAEYDVAAEMQSGVAWLLTQARGDGGFGTGAASNPFESGLALAAMSQIDTVPATVRNARTYLLSTQLPNGSWRNDAYSTAMALYGLTGFLNLQTRGLSLSPGLNLLGLPNDPLGTLSSTTLQSQLPGCTAIMGWNRATQSWIMTPFTVAMQDGFFAQATAAADASLLGQLPPANQCTGLTTGLNIVSIPNENSCYTGHALLQDINQCLESHRWDASGQRWLSAYKTAGDTLRGMDFPVYTGEGFFVRVGAPGTWCTQVCDTLTPPLLPDLVVTGADIYINPNPAQRNAAVEIYVNIRNFGTDTAFSPRLDIYNGDPAAGGVQLAGGTLPVDIPPGGESGYYGNDNFTFANAGSYQIYGIADRLNAIVESDETNNKDYRTLQIVVLTSTSLERSRDMLPCAEGIATLQPYGGPTSTNDVNGIDAVTAVGIDEVTVGSNTSSSAIVTWITDVPTTGCVQFGTTSVQEHEACEGMSRLVHLVELDGLVPGALYRFQILSYEVMDNNGGVFYRFSTTPVGVGTPAVLYGRVRRADLAPAPGVIVTATLRSDAKLSYPLSTLTAAGGIWTINPGDFKDAVTGAVLPYATGDTVHLLVQGGTDGVGSGRVTLAASPQNAGIITLGAPCACDCHGDPECDGIIANVFDVVRVVDVAFRNGATRPDSDSRCPFPQTDVDCNGVTNVFDVVRVVDVAFREGNPAVKYCEPCSP